MKQYCIYLDENFSDAVKPKPAITIYIIDSNNLESTL